jgi:monoamine oxidase
MISRKQFLKRMLWLAPLAGGVGSLMTSCRKPRKQDCQKKYSGKVIVVGAGAAGLYAAKLLSEKGADVVILEASARMGGRIKTLESFADFPIELGAEEIHGNKSTWYEIVKNSGANFVSLSDEDYYFYDGRLASISSIANNSDIQKVMEFVNQLENYRGRDVPLQQLIDELGNIQKTNALYNALLGNERGTSNHRLGAFSAAEEDRKWNAGEGNFLLSNQSLSSILLSVCQSILNKVQTNRQVTKIEYSGSVVSTTTADGSVYVSDKVLLTVPLTMLKKNTIKFTPDLSTSKKDAISTIGMDAGMKVILKFSSPFWNNDTGSIYGTGYVPEFWVTSAGRSTHQHILTAFVMGEKAEFLSTQEANAVNIIINELVEFFGSPLPQQNLVSSYIMDWSKEPFIEGAYSYASVGSHAMRKVLAEPINKKIFFAGEAVNTKGNIGTVHGAIESAIDAVNTMVCE